MTDERWPIRQISGNLQEFQGALSELTHITSKVVISQRVRTKVSWELKQEGDYTIVLFKHQGWKEPVEFMHHCSTKWGSF